MIINDNKEHQFGLLSYFNTYADGHTHTQTHKKAINLQALCILEQNDIALQERKCIFNFPVTDIFIFIAVASLMCNSLYECTSTCSRVEFILSDLIKELIN